MHSSSALAASRRAICCRVSSWILLAAFALLLAACGGGADDGATAEPVPSAGTRETTGRALDLAIDGDGMFVLESERGATRYSRYGRFDVDLDGRLVHASGARLVGQAPDAAESSAAGVLPVLALTMAPAASTRVRVVANLDARVEPKPEDFFPFDPRDANTFDHATSARLFDARGQTVFVTFYFRNVASGLWSVYLTANGVMVAGSAARLPLDGAATGPLTWTLDLPSVPTADRLDSTEPLPGVVFDFSGSSSFGSSFSVTELDHDGWPEGRLATIAVSPDGAVTLGYDNGQGRDGGRLLLAKFSVADRLVRRDDETWSCERDCRGPRLALPGSSLLGLLSPGVLETQSR